jgi:multiple antibiotic resistance protein
MGKPMNLLATIVLLIIIMDPFGNLVMINTLLGSYDDKNRRRIILREAIIAFLILVICSVIGKSFLNILGLQPHTLRISGGIVLFLIALGMVFPAKSVTKQETLADPIVVPIAMPLIAGPGSISIVFLLAHSESIPHVLVALTIASLVTSVILWLSPFIFRNLGKRGSVALERLTGMLLIMMSVQMLLDGFKDYMLING